MPAQPPFTTPTRRYAFSPLAMISLTRAAAASVKVTILGLGLRAILVFAPEFEHVAVRIGHVCIWRAAVHLATAQELSACLLHVGDGAIQRVAVREPETKMANAAGRAGGRFILLEGPKIALARSVRGDPGFAPLRFLESEYALVKRQCPLRTLHGEADVQASRLDHSMLSS